MASNFPFITDEQFERLLAHGRMALAFQENGQEFDPLPVVKLFTPDAGATWLLTEIDPEAPDILETARRLRLRPTATTAKIHLAARPKQLRYRVVQITHSSSTPRSSWRRVLPTTPPELSPSRTRAVPD